MNCDCIICRRNKADLVIKLLNEGKDFKQILSEVRKSHRVSDGVLEKHLRLTGNSEIIPPKNVNSALVANTNHFDFNSINFDEYNFDENNPESVIEYFQKCLLFMYGRQLQIVAAEQNEKYQGGDSSGLTEFLKLEKIEGMLHKIYPIHIFANQRIAMDVIARMGYKIILDTNVQIDPNTETDTEGSFEWSK